MWFCRSTLHQYQLSFCEHFNKRAVIISLTFWIFNFVYVDSRNFIAAQKTKIFDFKKNLILNLSSSYTFCPLQFLFILLYIFLYAQGIILLKTYIYNNSLWPEWIELISECCDWSMIFNYMCQIVDQNYMCQTAIVEQNFLKSSNETCLYTFNYRGVDRHK